MLVDNDAIRALGARCSAQADDLTAAADALKSCPGPVAGAAFGPIGMRFLAALTDAAASEARTLAALSAKLAARQPISAAIADAYADADRRNSRLL